MCHSLQQAQGASSFEQILLGVSSNENYSERQSLRRITLTPNCLTNEITPRIAKRSKQGTMHAERWEAIFVRRRPGRRGSSKRRSLMMELCDLISCIRPRASTQPIRTPFPSPGFMQPMSSGFPRVLLCDCIPSHFHALRNAARTLLVMR